LEHDTSTARSGRWGAAWVSTAHGEEATAYFVEAVKKSIAQLRTVGALE